MDVDQNIRFLEEQRKVFAFMLAETSASSDARERQLSTERAEVEELRSAIRALRRELVSDARLPSGAAIEERVRIGNRVERLEGAKRRVLDVLNKFTEMASEMALILADLSLLKDEGPSTADTDKVARFGALFSEQLHEYGVTSVSPAEIGISPDSFRAVYGDFDLQFDLSASDTIRSSWAYRTALLEVAREAATNHPGLLMLDEPRQQEASPASFSALLARLSTAENTGQQVILATSESRVNLERMIAGLPVTTIMFDSPILQRR